MPYPSKTVRLFQMIAHGKTERKGLSKGKASKLLAEAGQSHSSGHGKSKVKATSAKSY